MYPPPGQSHPPISISRCSSTARAFESPHSLRNVVPFSPNLGICLPPSSWKPPPAQIFTRSGGFLHLSGIAGFCKYDSVFFPYSLHFSLQYGVRPSGRGCTPAPFPPRSQTSPSALKYTLLIRSYPLGFVHLRIILNRHGMK